MNLRNYRCLVILALAFPSSLNALEITGTVREATGDTATVVTDGDVVPSVGDKVNIFFKLAGANDEISVGSGKVTEVNATSIKIKIDNASGTVSKGQLARFTSGTPQKKAATSTSPLPSSADKSAAHASIVGTWAGLLFGNKTTFAFKDDETFVWDLVEAGKANTIRGKYRVDYATQPHHIDLLDLNAPGLVGATLLGVFELQGDSRLKMDLSIGARDHPEKGFTDDAIIFSRVP